MPKEIRECNFCDKEFEHYTSENSSGKFCSRDCYNKSRRKRVFIDCKVCGEEIETYPSADRTTCSKECQYELFREKEERECKECRVEFKVKPSSNKKFCSKSCAGLKNNLDIELTCEECEENFVVEYSQRNQIYCSRECKYESQRDKSIKRYDFCQHPDCNKELNSKGDKDQRKYCSLTCASRSRVPDPIEIRSCKVCGKEFEVKRHRDKIVCSKSCSNKYSTDYITRSCRACDSDFVTTEAEDKKFCEFSCFKNFAGYGSGDSIVKNNCVICGDSFEVIESNSVTKTCSKVCFRELCSKQKRGENNPRWKGGSDQYPEYSGTWFKQRKKALERDGYKCKICGIGKDDLGKNPDVHHIKPVREFEVVENAHKLSNLVTLCHSHHQMVEGWFVVPSNVHHQRTT